MLDKPLYRNSKRVNNQNEREREQINLLIIKSHVYKFRFFKIFPEAYEVAYLHETWRNREEKNGENYK